MNARATRRPSGRGTSGRGSSGGKKGGGGGSNSDKITVGEMMGCGLFLFGSLIASGPVAYCVYLVVNR